MEKEGLKEKMLSALEDRKRKLKDELETFDLNQGRDFFLFSKKTFLKKIEVTIESRTMVTRKTRASAPKTQEEPTNKKEKKRKGVNNPALVGLLKDHEIYDDITYFRRVFLFIYIIYLFLETHFYIDGDIGTSLR